MSTKIGDMPKTDLQPGHTAPHEYDTPEDYEAREHVFLGYATAPNGWRVQVWESVRSLERNNQGG